MASTSHNPKILLRRVFSLNESAPFILCIDDLSQAGWHIIEEFAQNVSQSTPIVYVGYETVNKPAFATHFIEGTTSVERLTIGIQSYLPSQPTTKRHLVVIDSLNYIPNDQISQFISNIVSPSVTLLGIYHRSESEHRPASLENYPSSLSLLHFMASTVLECAPLFNKSVDLEEVESEIQRFSIPRGLNATVSKIIMTNRRKSGRSLVYAFRYNSQDHSYDQLVETEEDQGVDDSQVLEGLTTFNLKTSNKQKLAREQVELPFLEAQSFNTGGAIVYEFEKDDDYDEEDPYEDPF
ncbi:LAFE_0E13828g1_1 [Lachancea fermentati]|uniref:Elongator complex protein 5 n=1 Tax=Lachancea fermentati TaxID=4955 RepID=A0A1G4MDS0_LACFM|nr:LAFE_0E13828g1_1 [Lachancea fermentati]